MSVGGKSATSKRRGTGRLSSVVALLVAALLVGLAAAVVLAGPQLLAWSSQTAVTLPTGFTDSTSAQAMTERKAHERGLLESYGWVDKDAGIARIPVEQAIQRMAETGLPVGAPEMAATPENREAAVLPPSGDVSFAGDVLPIFVEHCSECHGADDPEEGLELITYRTLMLGSIYGAVIKAGNAEGSYLIEMVSSGKMPKKGDPLTSSQIEIIRAWIDAGALDK